MVVLSQRRRHRQGKPGYGIAPMVIVSPNGRVNRMPRTDEIPRKMGIIATPPPSVPAMRSSSIHRDI
jgi:hypothetical protein